MKIEFSTDQGKTWCMWVYFYPHQKELCHAAKRRLAVAYAGAGWQWRVVTEKPQEPIANDDTRKEAVAA
ncbi:MAG TPA: hypothetical protein VMX97_15620 [Hyphomicrobiaceae bacterium]|nr:hypothetical protein [Hyphomicrobiaceae bacterium]